MKKTSWLSILILLAAIWLWTGSARAQDSTPPPRPITDDEVNAIAKQMYCPVCENTPLDVCPTQACAEWRELIRDKLAEGWNEAQIKTYFVERFGDRVLATPPARGLNWLVYIFPPLAFLLGAYLLYRAFLSLRKPVSETPATTASLPAAEDDPYIKKLEDELRKL